MFLKLQQKIIFRFCPSERSSQKILSKAQGRVKKKYLTVDKSIIVWTAMSQVQYSATRKLLCLVNAVWKKFSGNDVEVYGKKH